MKDSRRIDDIEVLRGIAVIFVVLHHANGNLVRFPKDSVIGNFYHWFSGGSGVDLFFAISGFVIARSLLPQYSPGLDSAGFRRVAFNFWTRRAFRLLPSAWLWLGIILLLSVIFNDSGVFKSFETNLKSTIYAVLQIANVRFALTFMRESMGASFPYWSLSLEEQFYILFPFLALLPRRALVAALVCVIAYQLFSPRGIWQMAFRTDAISFGVLIAIMQNTRAYGMVRTLYERYPIVLFVAFPTLLVLIGMSSSHGMDWKHYAKSPVAVFSFLAVLLASLNADISAKCIPFHRAMIWVGARSYAIYLLHVPTYFIVKEAFFRAGARTSEHVLVAAAASTVLIILLAQINYRYIETPLRRRGAEIAQRRFGT